MKDDGQYERQERMFGADGQHRIADSNVMLCGLGGIGSHICQQLAQLGVRQFTLVDHDDIERSNLNRLVGSSSKHIGMTKVEFAGNMVKAINPQAIVEYYPVTIDQIYGLIPNNSYNVIVGSVDNDAARLQLTDIASENHIPYVDIASEIHTRDGILGGRVFISNGHGCLLCAGFIDQEEVRRINSSSTELEFEQDVYGVSPKHLKDSGPSVVSLNGVIASVAGVELMMLLTGSTTIPVTIFQRRENFLSWTLERPTINALTGCYYCSKYEVAAKYNERSLCES